MEKLFKEIVKDRIYKDISFTQYEKNFLIENNCYLSVIVDNKRTKCYNDYRILEEKVINQVSINHTTGIYNIKGIIKDLITLTNKVNNIISNVVLAKKIEAPKFMSFFILGLQNDFTFDVTIRVINPIIEISSYNDNRNNIPYNLENNIMNIIDTTINNIIGTYKNTYNIDNLELNTINTANSDNGITIFINRTDN